MNILKQRILVVAALGGAMLCVSAEKAHADEQLSGQEMGATLGAQENPTTPQDGRKINSICTGGPEVCTEDRAFSGASACVQHSPRSYNTCSEQLVRGRSCQWSGAFVETCHVTRWQTNGRRWATIIPGVWYERVPDCTDGDVISPYDDSTVTTGCI